MCGCLSRFVFWNSLFVFVESMCFLCMCVHMSFCACFMCICVYVYLFLCLYISWRVWRVCLRGCMSLLLAHVLLSFLCVYVYLIMCNCVCVCVYKCIIVCGCVCVCVSVDLKAFCWFGVGQDVQLVVVQHQDDLQDCSHLKYHVLLKTGYQK